MRGKKNERVKVKEREHNQAIGEYQRPKLQYYYKICYLNFLYKKIF